MQVHSRQIVKVNNYAGFLTAHIMEVDKYEHHADPKGVGASMEI